MAAVAPDADVLVGFLDPADAHHRAAVALLGPRLAGDDLVIGASIYAEILVRPLRRGRADTVDAFLADARARVAPVDRAVARRAAELRAAHRTIRLPDALALATALIAEARLLTLDRRLGRIARELGSPG